MLHNKFGYCLYSTKKEYALEHFGKSPELASTAHQKSQLYKCTSVTLDNLGDMERAIDNTQKDTLL